MEHNNTNTYIVREQELINADLSTYLKKHEQKDMLRFLVAGSVDDGKSTLIGRLLYDSHLIYKDHLNAVYKDSQSYNTTNNEIDLSLLTDGLKAEREQGITIDVAYRYFSTEKRSFIICDSPGHEQYTRNMATGASHCDMAIILIDARNGVKAQTRRHSLIAATMGIRQFVVLVNKMDLVNYSESTFNTICNDYKNIASQLNIQSLYFIPISALNGDNVVEPSAQMAWYTGKPLLNLLEEIPLNKNINLSDFRFPVQYVIRPNADFRGYTGNIASGTIQVGDEVMVLPSQKSTKIKSIETYDGQLKEANAPMPVVLTVTDDVDISRGNVLVKPHNFPAVDNNIQANIVWLDDAEALQINKTYLLKCATQCVPATLQAINYQVNIDNLEQQPAEKLWVNDIGNICIKTHRPLVFDSFEQNKKTGAFILINPVSNATCGAGVITQTIDGNSKENINTHLSIEKSHIDKDVREQLLGHKAATVWLTGLSGAGKSTIARALEAELVRKGINAFVLDGDNLRSSLNKNLGFSPEDRAENVRRTAEVAKLMNDAGIVVIVALISPYKADRLNAANIIGNNFYEIFVDADIETCRRRDPKGLYKKADEGQIKGFTGIDAPYEKPDTPALAIDTAQCNVQQAVDGIITIIKI